MKGAAILQKIEKIKVTIASTVSDKNAFQTPIVNTKKCTKKAQSKARIKARIEMDELEKNQYVSAFQQNPERTDSVLQGQDRWGVDIDPLTSRTTNVIE